MTITSASEAISSLINMTSRGEIDPWDIEVIAVIDRFLLEIEYSNALDLENLPRSGQAFLWASQLVKFKADTLERIYQEREEVPLDINLEDLEEELQSLPLYLENQLRRRTAAPPPRSRRVTLEELIGQLQEIAAEIESITELTARSKPKPRPHARKEAIEVITSLAHQENLTELAGELEVFLERSDRTRLEFEELLEIWPGPDEKVALFWALLLLASRSKVLLHQTDFYGDLTIEPINGEGSPIPD